MMNVTAGDKAEDLAYDRWPDVLQHAGLSDTYFSGRHTPCPVCGGTDRFRWSRKHGGLYVCSMCTDNKYSSGINLLMAVQGITFREAADFVRSYIKGVAPRAVTRAVWTPQRSAAEDAARNLERMERIWASAVPIGAGDPVDLYLTSRVPGLDFAPRWIRFHPSLDYWEPPATPGGKPVLLGKFPAMVASCFDAGGRFVQLHKTYLTSDGRKAPVPVVKKTERGLGVNGFAVPISRVEGDTLGLAEGIESALAGSMVRQVPVWPCLNGPSMAAYDLPEPLRGQVKRVVIFADHDPLKPVGRREGQGPCRLRSAGLHYAEQLTATLRARGVRVMIVKAARVGQDMADFWVEQQRRSPRLVAA